MLSFLTPYFFRCKNISNLRIECQIHYDGISTKGSLREVTDIATKELHINKSIRLKLGGENCHYHQCMNVPEKLDWTCFVHPECYKKFVYAETLPKKQKSENKNRSSKQLKTSKNDEADNRLFPNHCMICKSISIKVNSKKQLAKNILTYNIDSCVE